MRSTPRHGVAAFQKWSEPETRLNEQLRDCTEQVHRALCDNIDTRTVLMSIKDLVSNANLYIESKRSSKETHNRALLKNMASYITNIFDILGLITKPEQIGFASSNQEAGNAEEILLPYLDALASFRDNVRIKARALDGKGGLILKECDNLRDEILPQLGVRLEDKEDEPTVIKLVGKAELLKEREEKRLAEEKKKLEKEKKKAAEMEKQKALDAQKKVPPSEMFRKDDKFSKFDDKGIPTHDANGQEISNAQKKKLKKIYEAQEKKYNEYLASQTLEP